MKMKSEDDYHHIDIELVVQKLLNDGLVFSSPWLTARQAAQYCKISESYLSQLRSKKCAPVYYRAGSGRVVLYNMKDLDGWLKSKRVKGEPDANAR